MPDLPVAPTDLFTSEVAGVIDEANQIIADVGLRTYRVFLVIDKYEGQERRKKGVVFEREITEILPPPMVVFNSAAKVAHSHGALHEGSVVLNYVSRTLRQEQLQGRTQFGDALPVYWDFAYAVLPIGQQLAEFYVPSSIPILLPTAWTVGLRPINRREALNVGPD